jgi:AcrR family transcriptional regulator
MVELCVSEGYAAVTVSGLIDAAGVSKSEFRELFETREDCLVAALQQFNANAEPAIAQAVAARDKSWTDRVAGALEALLRACSANPGLARLVFVDSVAVAESDEAIDAGPKVIEGLLGRVREAHPGAPDPVPGAERAAVGAAVGIIGEAASVGSEKALMDLLPDLVYVVTVPYLGQAEAVAASSQFAS